MSSANLADLTLNYATKRIQAGVFTASSTGKSTDSNAVEYGALPAPGAPAGTGVTSGERAGAVRQVAVTFDGATVTMADNAGVVAFGSLKFYDLPAGLIYILGCTASLTLTRTAAGINADFDGDFGIGTVAANNGATLATTEQNIIPTTATAQAVAGVATITGRSTATEIALYDGTATAVDVYLNILVDDADHDITTTPSNLTVSGTILLTYINLGDI